MSVFIAKIYADLVKKGKKTIEDVPDDIRGEVQQQLEHDENA